MIDPRRETLAGLYVVGALTAAEAREFEATLAGDLELQSFVQKLRDAPDVVPMAHPAPPPPPSFKARWLTLLGLQGSPNEASHGPVWLPWAIAIGFGILCILLLLLGNNFRRQAVQANRELAEARQQVAALESERDDTQRTLELVQSNAIAEVRKLREGVIQQAADFQKQRSTLENQLAQRTQEFERKNALWQQRLQQHADAIAQLNQAMTAGMSPEPKDRLNQFQISVLVPTADGNSRALGGTVWDPIEQRGLFSGQNFSPPGPNRDYQLWVLDPRSSTPLNAGVLTVGERGLVKSQFRLPQRMDTIERYGVTIERKGGSSAPQGRYILISN